MNKCTVKNIRQGFPVLFEETVKPFAKHYFGPFIIWTILYLLLPLAVFESSWLVGKIIIEVFYPSAGDMSELSTMAIGIIPAYLVTLVVFTGLYLISEACALGQNNEVAKR